MNQRGAIGAVFCGPLQDYMMVSYYAMVRFSKRNLRRDFFNDRWKKLSNVPTSLGRHENRFIGV